MGRDLNDVARERGRGAVAALVDDAPRWRPPAADARPPLTLIRGLGPADAGRLPIVKGLWARGELSAFYGPPKSGKSFLATDAALAVASGAEHWHGFRVKGRGQVLYCVLEGAAGFRNRLDAWARHNGREPPAAFVRTPDPLRFLDEPTRANAEDDVARIAAAAAELEAETGEPVVLVVVDTVARAMAGGDENNAQDMGAFLGACQRLQAMPSRPHVCVVHHAGKDETKGARGSTALPAGVDMLVRLERGLNGNTWKVERAKDDPETDWFGFRLQGVELGRDEDGDAVTNCVVVKVDAAEVNKAGKGPKQPAGTNQRLVWRALGECEADPERVRRATMLTEVPYEAVHMEALRTRAYALADWPEHKRKDRFREGLNGLVGGGLVSVDSRREWVWRTS